MKKTERHRILLNSVQFFLMTLKLVANNVVKRWTVACFVVKTLDIWEKYIEIYSRKL